MPLHLHLTSSLDDAVAPLAALLAAPAGDPFVTELVVAPSVGVQQWLSERLARALGATPGSDDGIVANVRFVFPGALVSRALGGRTDDDPWSVERLTFTLLDVIAEHGALVSSNRRASGLLSAARGIADLFDRYHVHRPEMILEWARSQAVLTAVHGEPVPALPERTRWQYDLWRAARERVGQLSPPERAAAALAALRNGERPAGLPPRVAIVGVTAMSLLHLDVVHALSAAMDVHLWLLHPSPALARATRDKLGALPRRARFAASQNPARGAATLPQLESWTSPAQGMQVLLASAGVDVPMPGVPVLSGDALLARLQHALRTDALPEAPAPVSSDDHSFRIHRCHGAARQAEVLREALLHTFREMPGLDPRDVLIVAPDIPAMAPHLEAVFGDPYAADASTPLHLPVVIADRSLRQTNEVAGLLALLMELPARRFGLADFREITALSVVQRRLDADAATVDRWLMWAGHLRVRWGVTPEHRTGFGLPAEFTDHSWLHAARRLAYGALLSDAPPTLELGDVIPAHGVEAGDLPAVGGFARLLGTLAAFVDQVHAGERRTDEWCDLLQSALGELCAVEHTEEPQLATALAVLDSLRAHAARATTPVPFHEVRTLLAPLLAGAPGHVMLRSGGITATSFVPLRGVPYRVICLVGLDDGALVAGDGDGDDLMRQHPLVGDPDARAEQRQALLETILAARDRVIITCTGRDPRTNAEVPWITPLAELVDLVQDVSGNARGAIIGHPRHAMDARNFMAGELGVTGAFGHVEAHVKAARVMANGRAAPAPAEALPAVEPPREITLDELVQFVSNPLDVYVKRTLGIDVWEGDGEPGAVIELKADAKEIAEATAPLLEQLRATPDDPGAVARLGAPWQEIVKRSGILPPGAYGTAALQSGLDLVAHIQRQCAIKSIPLERGRAEEVRIDLGNGRVVTGTVDGIMDQPGGEYALVQVFTARNDDRRAARQQLSTWLYAVHTGDAAVRSLWIGMNPDKAGASYARRAQAAEGATPEALRHFLAELVALADEATTAPRAMFGDTASHLRDSRVARTKFDQFCSQRLKPFTSEHRIYGDSPRFDEVFTEETVDFHVRLLGVLAGGITVSNDRASTKKWPPARSA